MVLSSFGVSKRWTGTKKDLQYRKSLGEKHPKQMESRQLSLPSPTPMASWVKEDVRREVEKVLSGGAEVSAFRLWSGSRMSQATACRQWVDGSGLPLAGDSQP